MGFWNRISGRREESRGHRNISRSVAAIACVTVIALSIRVLSTRQNFSSEASVSTGSETSESRDSEASVSTGSETSESADSEASISTGSEASESKASVSTVAEATVYNSSDAAATVTEPADDASSDATAAVTEPADNDSSDGSGTATTSHTDSPRVLASFTLPFSNTETAGGSNINASRACRFINGVVVEPGEEFSYNEALGQRTTENGYVSGTAYAGGSVVQQTGGGICKISTMLYNLCLISGMEVTERWPHTMLVEYVPGGLDAAVAWGYEDFRFVNSLDVPIRIEARRNVTDKTFTVKFVAVRRIRATDPDNNDDAADSSTATDAGNIDFSGTSDYTEEHEDAADANDGAGALTYYPESKQINDYQFKTYLGIFDSNYVKIGTVYIGTSTYYGTGQS
ncbi:MAG: VanW family protein [Lachnospiraceae bacterium]|jgi:hypothetical protein